jgi:ComF family protein
MRTAERSIPIPRMAPGRLLDFAYPRLCIVCTRPSSPDLRWMCAECIDALRINAAGRNACPWCGQNRTERRCDCTQEAHAGPRTFSLFDFDETVKPLVHAFKYGGLKRLAFDIGRHFASLLPPEFRADADAVVPIPLHWARTLKRGYNQAAWLARGFCAGLGAPALLQEKLVRRARHTKTQTRLDRNRRAANMAGAFRLHPRSREFPVGKRIILVDDVVTTGATTAQCAQVLTAGGAKEVMVISLARD